MVAAGHPHTQYDVAVGVSFKRHLLKRRASRPVAMEAVLRAQQGHASTVLQPLQFVTESILLPVKLDAPQHSPVIRARQFDGRIAHG